MRRLIAIFLIVAMLCSIMPYSNVFADAESELKAYLQTLTPEKVLKRANEDMKELYGKDNYFLNKTNKGVYNTALVQKRIDEGIKDPKKFKGFEIVYGDYKSDYVIHKGIKMYRYAGYNKHGEPISTEGFPWDAGWSGLKLQNFNMLDYPWKRGKVVKSDFDYPFAAGVTDKFKEYLPDGTLEQAIIDGLNNEYAEKMYKEYMYNNQNSELAGEVVYTKNATPPGGKWIDYVHIIQPPTYLSQGLGRIYTKSSTYKDIPIAPLIALEQDVDLSAAFDSITAGAFTGDEVKVSVKVMSTFPKEVTAHYTWIVTRVSDGKVLTTGEDNLQYTGHASAQSGPLGIAKNGKRLLYVAFTMPEGAVRVQFRINEKGKAPVETELDNNVLDSTIHLVTPQKLPYDLLSKKVRFDLPSNTVTLNLPSLPEAKWTGNATGALQVTNRTPDLYRDFEVLNNPVVNEASETITRKPVLTYTIKRQDFGDNPENRKWLNLKDPGTPLEKIGEVYYAGSISRPYQYTYSWQTCSGEGDKRVCTDHSEIRTGTANGDFQSDTVNKPYDMYVYNGRKDIPLLTYKDEIEDNQVNSLQKKLYWTNEPYKYNVLRWMHHQDVVGTKYNWTKVPGQYEREFIQQASGNVGWTVVNSMDEEYSQARKAASDRSNKKSLYDKVVFATDRELQRYEYPVKSGYYFNPAGSYNLTVKTVVFKPTDKDTKDHEDMVNAVIDSFRYETDLMYINNNKVAVTIRNEPLSPKGGGFDRKIGVLSAKDSQGVNGAELVSVLDRSKDDSRYTKKVEEIPYTNKRGGDSHKFWKMILEGYSESYTESSNTYYNYREYVESDQHMYKITETTNVTIKINPNNIPLYTHANMPNGTYNIKAWIDNTTLTKGNYAYKGLGTLRGIAELDSIPITVVGSMYDDLNN